MNKLTATEFKKMFGNKMIKLEDHEMPPFDFWEYVETINPDDFQGYDFSNGFVDLVYKTDDRKYQHVLIKSKEDKDVFMTIVLDIGNKSVVGHHLLDLKKEYGLNS